MAQIHTIIGSAERITSALQKLDSGRRRQNHILCEHGKGLAARLSNWQESRNGQHSLVHQAVLSGAFAGSTQITDDSIAGWEHGFFITAVSQQLFALHLACHTRRAFARTTALLQRADIA